MGYREKAEDSFFLAGLTGYREKPEEEDAFFFAGLMGYLDEDPCFFAGFLVIGRVGTGTLVFWNCWGYG